MTAVTHGSGRFDPDELGSLGEGVVIEEGVLVFNPAHVHLGDRVYVGHRTMLKGDTRGELVVGERSWIGQNCFFHSAGGIRIGVRVGVGPGVMILTSRHEETPPGTPIMDGALEFGPVEIGDGCDVGMGSLILPGTKLGAGVQVGAGSVVRGEWDEDLVIAGVPARVLRRRGGPA